MGRKREDSSINFSFGPLDFLWSVAIKKKLKLEQTLFFNQILYVLCLTSIWFILNTDICFILFRTSCVNCFITFDFELKKTFGHSKIF